MKGPCFTLMQRNVLAMFFSGSNRQGRGGGVGIFVIELEFVCFRNLNSVFSLDIEYHVVKLIIQSIKCCVRTIYRPPGGNWESFSGTFDEDLASYALEFENTLFLGDFNFSRKNSAWDEFDYYIDELNLINHAKIQTHVYGNTLDFVLSNFPWKLI